MNISRSLFSNLLRITLFTVIFLCVVYLAGPATAETISTPSIMEITFKDDLISAELVDVPLIDVLKRLKQEFGFKAHFYGDLTEPITLSFKDFQLDKCLQQLTTNHSLSVASQSKTKLPGQNDLKEISEIWVLSRSTISKKNNVYPVAQALPAPAPLDTTAKVSDASPESIGDGDQEDISLGQLLINPDAKRSDQRKAIMELAAIGDAASVLTMAEFLGHSDKEVRQLLVSGISSVQNEESTLVLGQILQDESDPGIRKIVVRTLGQRKDDEVALALLGEAINDADEEVKTLAEQLLAE
jgi:hypothetical protein